MSAHHHQHRTEDSRRMWIVLAINLLMLAAGVIGGIVFDSLALLADAGHVLADVGAIGLALFAAWLASQPSSPQRTFGFRRTEILAALANGILLVAVSVLVFVEAVARFSNPPDVQGAGVLIVGAFGLAGNAIATWMLMRGDRSNLNLEGVLRHSAADALGSLGVIVAGLLVITTGWNQADALVSMAIGVLILLGSWRLISEPINVLMEAAPPGLDVQEIGTAMAAVDGVREVHDLHVWTVTSGFPALAAHVLTEPTEDVDEVRRRVERVLADRFSIEHTTLQMMVERLIEIEDRRGR